MDKMNEEEIIERANHFVNIHVLYGKTYGMTCDDLKEYQHIFRGLLDLYQQEKEKNKELETQRQNGTLTDGFHTFNDLYYQRCILFATICNLNKNIAWKSKKHNDGKKCFDSDQWFIVGIDTPEGTYTYHYEITYWDLFTIQELEKGKEWDGHTEKDVTRLLSLINNNISKGKIKEKIEYYKRLLNEDNWGEKTELGFKNRAVALQELLEEE